MEELDNAMVVIVLRYVSSVYKCTVIYMCVYQINMFTPSIYTTLYFN